MVNLYSSIASNGNGPRSRRFEMLLLLAVLGQPFPTRAAETQVAIQSPDGRNAIAVETDGEEGRVQYAVSRDAQRVIETSPLGPVLRGGGSLGSISRIIEVKRGESNKSFTLHWGKTKSVVDHYSHAVVTLATRSGINWQIELRAYNDGVAFRYRLLEQEGIREFELVDEETRFRIARRPVALFNMLDSFTTSHETVYDRKPLTAVPAGKLIDMPLLLTWEGGSAAALTEARVRSFAGMYLERESGHEAQFRCRLSPLPSDKNICVRGKTPAESPWRVVLLEDTAGKLLESNLLLCLNDPPTSDFSWALPGKTTFHWWNGEFEEDFKSKSRAGTFLTRHRAYIDFCARNNISYHSVSGDGRSWYVQSSTNYGVPGADADVRVPRPEIELPKILAYARERGVGIRLWVHWKPLSEQLEEAFTLYEAWGIKGLMVDFLDRDDQEMIGFTERMLESAARHKLHIQIHGSSKYSGEQRTFPNLFNREGVLNLEYLKWSNLCTPAHAVNVAYTRALAGPVDYHLGGFHSASRAEFKPRDRAPVVMGTRCHNLALYVIYENPMPMVADSPDRYEGQAGFDFLKEVPTTWDETRFLAGEPGEYVVLARRKGDTWYLGGITNWTPREIALSLNSLASTEFQGRLFVDGSLDESQPNAIREELLKTAEKRNLDVSMAAGGGFVAILRAK